MLTRGQEDHMRACVTRGATTLDEKYPSWFKKIDLDTLDLGNCEKCVCGQLAYSYYIDMEDADPFGCFARKLIGRLSKVRQKLLAGRIYIGGTGTDVNGGEHYAELFAREAAEELVPRLRREGADESDGGDWMHATEKLGFDIPSGLDNTTEGYVFLDDQWQRQIKRRLRAAA